MSTHATTTFSLFSPTFVDAVASAALLVRDVDGRYRPARAAEVLQHARRALSQQVRRGATMASPQAVKDYLRVQIGCWSTRSSPSSSWTRSIGSLQ